MKLSMRKVVYVIGLVPITLLAIIILIYTSVKLENSIHEEVEHKLEVSATALKAYAIENYEAEGEFSNDYNYIDSMDETNVKLTLIKDNVRFITTLRNDDGSRNEGTKIDDKVYDELLKGNFYYSRDIVIGGEDYAVYYEPITIDGKYIGAAFAGQSVESISTTVNEMRFGIGVAVLGVYILCAIILTVLAGLISKQMRKAAEALMEMASGNLNKEIEVHSFIKETVSIADSAEKLKEQLRNIVTAIRQDAVKLNTSNAEFLQKFNDIQSNVENVNTAVEEIALGATSQAQDTTSMTEQVAEMGNVVEDSNSQVKKLEDTIERMNLVAAKADELLNNLVKINARTQQSIGVVEGQTKATNVSAEKIQEAIEVIQEIAEQTNLLSLNASIEAARAGEQGRGFAVVAGEISTLADNSAKSAALIESIIRELTANSNESVATMKEVLTDTDTEHEALVDTQSAFEKLKLEVEEVSKVCMSISDQMNKLNVSRGYISDSTENLSAISEENAASTEETSASMHELHTTVETCTSEIKLLNQLSENLEKEVAIFHV